METKDSLNTALDVVKTAKEVLPKTTEETDGVISTLIGWFNNVVLFPVKKANIEYRYKLECFKEDLYNNVVQIPEQYVHEPDIAIAGPTLEALKYTYDEQELREMYVKLLSASLDSRKDSVVHPSYVEVIKQMNSYDARLFKQLVLQTGYIKAINPKVKIEGTGQVYVDAMPEWYIDYEEKGDIFQTSAALVRLAKLGLIELMFDRTAGKEGYDVLKKSEALNDILQRYQMIFPEQKLILGVTESVLYVNDYGKQFAKTCL